METHEHDYGLIGEGKEVPSKSLMEKTDAEYAKLYYQRASKVLALRKEVEVLKKAYAKETERDKKTLLSISILEKEAQLEEAEAILQKEFPEVQSNVGLLDKAAEKILTSLPPDSEVPQ